MATTRTDCWKKAHAASAGLINADQLKKFEQIAKQKFEIKKGAKMDMDTRAKLNDFVDTEIKNQLQTILKERISKLSDNPIESRWRELFRNAKEKGKWFTDVVRNVGERVHDSQKALELRLQGELVRDIKRAGLYEYWKVLEKQDWTNPETRNTGIELAALRGNGKSGVTGDSMALKMAQLLKNQQDKVTQMKARVGVDVGDLYGYIVKHSWAQNLVRQGGRGSKLTDAEARKVFTDYMVNTVDRERNFKGLEGIMDTSDPKELAKYFDEQFGRLESGLHGNELDTPTLISVQRKMQGKTAGDKMRVIHFKDAASEMDALQKYGHFNLTDSIVSELSSGARQIELSRAFGTNPANLYERVVRNLANEQRQQQRPTTGQSIKDAFLNIDNVFKELDGSVYLRQSPSVARWGSFLRAIESIQHLGLVVPASIADMASTANQLNINGVPYWQALGHTLKNVAGYLFTHEGSDFKLSRKAIAENLWVEYAYPFASLWKSVTMADNQPGKISEALNIFFTLNGMNRWTRAVQESYQMKLSNLMGQFSDRAFDALPDKLKATLSRYEIDAPIWEKVRKNVQTDQNNFKYITQESIDAIEGDNALKDAYHSKFGAMFVGQTERAVPQPGAIELALMRQGTQAGTIPGELARMISQFKGFPIAMITRGIGENWKDGNNLGANIRQVSQFITTLTLAGAFSDFLFQTATGGDAVKNWKEHPIKSGFRAMNRGGAMTYLGDTLMKDYTKFDSPSIAQGFLGPVWDDVESVLRAGQQTVTGQMTWQKAVKTIDKQIPNIWFMRQMIEFSVLNDLQEFLQPGYLQNLQESQQEIGRGNRFAPLSVGQ